MARWDGSFELSPADMPVQQLVPNKQETNSLSLTGALT